jgi:nucleotide-binding universal stress UspA family protein
MPTRTADFRILATADGSAPARAAVATLVDVPWPESARVRVVAARNTRAPHRRSILLSALDQSADAAAERARRVLAKRWPDAEAVVVDKVPIAGILAEAERFRADVIVVGWRGHGPVRRLLMGSVSRGVVRAATCSVLVVRRRPAHVQTIVIGFDGSPNARRAVSLVASFSAPRDGQVTLIGVVGPAPTARGPAVAGIRRSVAREVRRITAERSSAAMKGLNGAAAELKRAGWRTRVELRTGEPLRELVSAANRSRPQLLVVGARGTTGMRHLLLGSVAEGVLSRSQVPVLVAR